MPVPHRSPDLNAVSACRSVVVLLVLATAITAAAAPLCPPGRPPRLGEKVLLNLPANVRASPGGRILWKEARFGPDHRLLGQIVRAERRSGDWFLVQASPWRETGSEPPARGWVHVSNVQPVCVIREPDDLTALPSAHSRIERIAPASDDGLPQIELRAFGHGTGQTIEVQQPFAYEYLFETGDARHPLAYMIDSDDMTGGALVAFGPAGPLIWEHPDRISLDQVRAGGEIVLLEDYECMPLFRTLALRNDRFVALAARFVDHARAQSVPPLFDPDHPCTMIDKSGKVVRLAPGQKLQLESLTPKGLIRVRLGSGVAGTIDPSLAAQCFQNRLCAG